MEFKGDQANGWQLIDGQYVDIIFIPNYNNREKQLQADGVQEASETASLSSDAAVSAANGKSVILIPEQVKVLKNIRIAGLIDENGKLADVSNTKGTPRYISFEVTAEQATFLAYAKRNGQLELSSIPGQADPGE